MFSCRMWRLWTVAVVSWRLYLNYSFRIIQSLIVVVGTRRNFCAIDAVTGEPYFGWVDLVFVVRNKLNCSHCQWVWLLITRLWHKNSSSKNYFQVDLLMTLGDDLLFDLYWDSVRSKVMNIYLFFHVIDIILSKCEIFHIHEHSWTI